MVNWASSYGGFPNPPAGASIYYYLKDKPKGELKIEILDASGRLVQHAEQRAARVDPQRR